jgi:hypothetical protein
LKECKLCYSHGLIAPPIPQAGLTWGSATGAAVAKVTMATRPTKAAVNFISVMSKTVVF